MKNIFKKTKPETQEKPVLAFLDNVQKAIKKTEFLSMDELCELLQTSPDALEAFQKSYEVQAVDYQSDDLFGTNAKQTSATMEHLSACPTEIIDRIICGLMNKTNRMTVKDGKVIIEQVSASRDATPVTRDELAAIDVKDRPWLTAEMMKVDINEPSGKALAWFWKSYLEETNPKKKQDLYNHFRQGLDILDLDELTYAMIDQNPCSMGHWLPQIAEAAWEDGFFKIPDTTVIQVPMPLLQLTRQPYEALNGTTLKIIDGYCHRVFQLDDTKEYFVKTGTFSSKYDFRNCHVKGIKEVRELGEYLLFIHQQALMAASPLCRPCIYGMSTTTEWVVRDFIAPKEDIPSIYKGLPLRTEYRVFIDFDEGQVLAIAPYWDPATMKDKFKKGMNDNPHDFHDMAIYKSREKELMSEFDTNKEQVLLHCRNLARTANLTGQWSLDIMQNGNEFWLIDMATAYQSALREYVPEYLLKKPEENWLPVIK